MGIYYAFTKFNFQGGLFGSPFIGLENFRFLFSSGKLQLLTINTIGYNLAFILISNILQIPHRAAYTFYPLLISSLGGNKIIVGNTSAVMFLSEGILMFCSRRLLNRFRAGKIIIISGIFFIVWQLLYSVINALWQVAEIALLKVSQLTSIEQAYAQVCTMTDRIDLLINNAGIADSAGDITCLENMEAGSMSVCHREEGCIYPMSKAALNMTVRLLFEELRGKGFTFRLYNPGWLKSYMPGTKNVVGRFEPEESSRADYEKLLGSYEIYGFGLLTTVSASLPLLQGRSQKRLCFLTTLRSGINQVSEVSHWKRAVAAACNMAVCTLFNRLSRETFTFRIFGVEDFEENSASYAAEYFLQDRSLEEGCDRHSDEPRPLIL